MNTIETALDSQKFALRVYITIVMGIQYGGVGVGYLDHTVQEIIKFYRAMNNLHNKFPHLVYLGLCQRYNRRRPRPGTTKYEIQVLGNNYRPLHCIKRFQSHSKKQKDERKAYQFLVMQTLHKVFPLFFAECPLLITAILHYTGEEVIPKWSTSRSVSVQSRSKHPPKRTEEKNTRK